MAKWQINGIFWTRYRNRRGYFSSGPNTYNIDAFAGTFELWHFPDHKHGEHIGTFGSVSVCMQVAEIHFVLNDHVNEDIDYG